MAKSFQYQTYGTSCDAGEVERFLDHMWLANQRLEDDGRPQTPLCIWGRHGIGETDLVAAMAARHGADFVAIAPAQFEEMGDLMGMPVVVGDGTATRMAPPEWVPRDDGPGVLLIDDVNRADDRILRGLMQLFQNFELAGWALPKRWQIVMTANPDGGGETKLAKRLGDLSKASDGELDGEKLAEIMLGQGAAGLKYLLKLRKKGPKVVDLLRRLRQGDRLDLSGRELTRIPDDIAALSDLRSLNAAGNRIHKLTDGLFSLTELEALELGDNALSQVPEGIAQLTALRDLDLSDNTLPWFPVGIQGLTELTHLNLGRDTYSGNMVWPTVGDEIAPLQALRVLGLQSHRFETPPEGLRSLPNLEELAIGWGRWPVLPEWLAELPSLTKLEIQYLQWEDDETSQRTLGALRERGVQVVR